MLRVQQTRNKGHYYARNSIIELTKFVVLLRDLVTQNKNEHNGGEPSCMNHRGKNNKIQRIITVITIIIKHFSIFLMAKKLTPFVHAMPPMWAQCSTHTFQYYNPKRYEFISISYRFYYYSLIFVTTARFTNLHLYTHSSN